THTPLAWARRKPGWMRPLPASMASVARCAVSREPPIQPAAQENVAASAAMMAAMAASGQARRSRDGNADMRHPSVEDAGKTRRVDGYSPAMRWNNPPPRTSYVQAPPERVQMDEHEERELQAL